MVEIIVDLAKISIRVEITAKIAKDSTRLHLIGGDSVIGRRQAKGKPGAQ